MRKATWGVAALLLWLCFPALLIVAGLGSFVAPAKVDEWKAQGVTQAPTAWQLIIDGSDMVKNRWFVVFPLLLIAALFTTRRFIFASRAEPQLKGDTTVVP